MREGPVSVGLGGVELGEVRVCGGDEEGGGWVGKRKVGFVACGNVG